MSKKNNGGPAFPSPGYSDDGERRGMSLRDWFAGQAMAGICGGTNEAAFAIKHVAAKHGLNATDIIAKSAYEHADAMLAERER